MAVFAFRGVLAELEVGGGNVCYVRYVRRIWAHEISFFVLRLRDIARLAQAWLSLCSGFAQAYSLFLTLITISAGRKVTA